MTRSLIEIVKGKLSEPKPSDAILADYIEEVEQSILNYCNISIVPDELRFVHANMVVDLVKGNQRDASEDGSFSVKSIKEGDATVQFGGVKIDSYEQAMKDLLFNYKEQLNRFRKLRW